VYLLGGSFLFGRIPSAEAAMSYEAEGGSRSPIVGDLNLPGPDPEARVSMLIELNVMFPGGLGAVRSAFYELWQSVTGDRVPAASVNDVTPRVPTHLELIAPKLYQGVLSRRDLRRLVDEDQGLDRPPTIFRVWPDYTLEPQIDRSAPTVKVDAAWRSYDARGSGIVWAVIDSGIDACHPHFAKLELAEEGRGEPQPSGVTSNLHRDFSYLVQPEIPPRPGEYGGPNGSEPPQSLRDRSGHGTHVAGIIAGCAPAGDPNVSDSKEPGDGGYVPRRAGTLSGMAPNCELVSLKVMRRSEQGTWVTSSAAVIRALTYLRTEVNVDPALLRVHGVNMSLGCEWHPEQYAAGQSPLCQALNQLVQSGVVVVVSAGNFGARANGSDTAAVLGSITEPAHAEECVAVGSTHREAPHAFGVTWTSGKGPTLDGRMKPDVVAPGEWIASAAAGEVCSRAGIAESDPKTGRLATYAEQSGTSMAAPHVSGVIAAFLSARPEFVGRPRQVKRLLMETATDLGRERYAQGAGLVDLMRMLSNV
jgi:subtilisin family serine protease